MRDRMLVAYAVPQGQQGRPMGVYTLTSSGGALLQQRLAALSSAALPAAAPIETGSMRGERRMVVRSTASECALPPGAITSVFHLAQAIASSGSHRELRHGARDSAAS